MANEETERMMVINALLKYPTNVLELAVMYASSMTAYGVDITSTWETAVQQLEALEKAERKGYCDAMMHTYGKKMDEINSKYCVNPCKDYEEDFIEAQRVFNELLQTCKGIKLPPKWSDE